MTLNFRILKGEAGIGFGSSLKVLNRDRDGLGTLSEKVRSDLKPVEFDIAHFASWYDHAGRPNGTSFNLPNQSKLMNCSIADNNQIAALVLAM